MKCIDAIEGILKCIIRQWHAASVESNLDDSEYVRNVKAVIDATRQFIAINPEIVEDPRLLIDVLYDFSRNLWLGERHEDPPADPAAKSADITPANEEYQTYYYDFLYHRGLYPQ